MVQAGRRALSRRDDHRAVAASARSWRGADAAASAIASIDSLWLLPLALVCAAIALFGWAYSPGTSRLPAVRISSDAPFKSMTVALLIVAIWLGASSRLRSAYARRSVFAFYAIATVFLALCSLGPKPTLAGHQFLYQPPVRLADVVSGLRRDPRTGTHGPAGDGDAATVGALAFHRLQLTTEARHLLAAVLLIGIVADGWIEPLALPTAAGHLAAAARAEGSARCSSCRWATSSTTTRRCTAP